MNIIVSKSVPDTLVINISKTWKIFYTSFAFKCLLVKFVVVLFLFFVFFYHLPFYW